MLNVQHSGIKSKNKRWEMRDASQRRSWSHEDKFDFFVASLSCSYFGNKYFIQLLSYIRSTKKYRNI